MSAEKLIADRIAGPGLSKDNISGPIVKIGIVGISLGVAVMLITVSIVLGFKNEIVNRITGLTTHVSINSISLNASNEPEPICISNDTLEKIRNLPAVKHLQGTAFKNGLLKTELENEGVLLKGVDKDYDFSFLKQHLIDGRLPQFSDSAASRDMLISAVLAEKLGLKTGDKLTVYFIAQHEIKDSLSGEIYEKSEQRSRRLSVCGIFKTDFSDFDEKLSIVDLRQIRNINFWDAGMTGAYEITIDDFKNSEQVVEELHEMLGYNYNVQSARESFSNIFTWLEKLDVNGIIVVVMMVLVATINMVTALLILILERANMVGLVKAFGMNDVSVRKIFILISYRLIGRGMIWGNIAGIGLCLLQYYFKFVKMDGSTYYVDYVAIHIDWGYFLLLNICTFIACALMLLLPTIILTKLTPVRTLKFD